MDYEYIVVKYRSDDIQALDVPIGLVYWPEGQLDNMAVRLPHEDEIVQAVPAEATQHAGRSIELLKRFLAYETPYWNDEKRGEQYWRHVVSLFIHTIRMTTPRRISINNPDIDFDLQFSAIVRPRIPKQREDVRIDSWVNEALGNLSSRFQSQSPVPGYQGREVKVLKRTDLGNRIVAVDAVNLTIQNAERELEAMIHRATELLYYTETTKPITLLLGYYSSPEGLNGEAKLVSLARKITGQEMIDLSKPDELRKSLLKELAFT